MTSFDLHVPPSATRGIVTIGNFDGVHRGHQAMLSTVRDVARQQSLKAIVVTFDPHPVNVLKPDVNLPRLTTIAARTTLLKRYGADEVVVLPVSRQLLNMSPDRFFSDVVVRELAAAGVVEGPDFRFGKDRSGDTQMLQSLCDEANLGLTVIPSVCNSNQMISSTEIRRLLIAGDVSAATELLGHSYSITGRVVRGAGRGRTLDFPTANIEEIDVLIPPDGVYTGATTIDGHRYAAAVSIGPNPTFRDNSRKVECHFAGFSGDLYNTVVTVDLSTRLRGLQTFDSAEELMTQIRWDVNACCEVMKTEEPSRPTR